MGCPISSNAFTKSSDYLQRLTADTTENVDLEKVNSYDFPSRAKITSVRSANGTVEPERGMPLDARAGDHVVRDYESSKSTLWSRVCHFVKEHKLAVGIGSGLVVLGALASHKALAAQTPNPPTNTHLDAEKLYVEIPKPAVGITVPEPDLHNPVLPKVKATTKQATTQIQAPKLDCLKIIDTSLMHKNIKITNDCNDDVSLKLFLNRRRGNSMLERRFAVAKGENQRYQRLSVDKQRGIEFQKPGNHSTFDSAPWKKDTDFFHPKIIQIQIASNLKKSFNVKLEDCKTLGNPECVPLLSKVGGIPKITHSIKPGQAPVVSTMWFPSGNDRQIRAYYSIDQSIYSPSDDRAGNDLTLADQVTNQTSFATLDKNHDGILKATHRLVLADQSQYAASFIYTFPRGKTSDLGGNFKFDLVDGKSSKVYCEALSEGDSGGFPESSIVRHKTRVLVGSGQKSNEAPPAMTFRATLGGKEYYIGKLTNTNSHCVMPAGTTQLKVKASGDFTTFSGADLHKHTDSSGVCFKSTGDAVTLHQGSRCQ